MRLLVRSFFIPAWKWSSLWGNYISLDETMSSFTYSGCHFTYSSNRTLYAPLSEYHSEVQRDRWWKLWYTKCLFLRSLPMPQSTVPVDLQMVKVMERIQVTRLRGKFCNPSHSKFSHKDFPQTTPFSSD